MKKKKILFVFGTRPEAIKLAPVIHQFKLEKTLFDVSICSTGQHGEMLNQVINFFEIKLNYNLKLMTPNQSLSSLSSKILTHFDEILKKEKPDYIFVHGDTTTSAFASIVAFYNQIKVCHVEAGLRTFDKYSPFPEEMNRSIVGRIADLHFAPTENAKNNLIKENIKSNSIVITGNTVIDALFYGIKRLENYSDKTIEYLNNNINFKNKIILITSHRRENFGKKLKNICEALIEISKQDNVELVYPVHLNPNISETVKDMLSGIPNIHLLKPLNYPAFIWLMKKSFLILTDSGGIQEEAPSLNVPVLIMRNNTERPEGIQAKTALLVGAEKNKIINNTIKLLEDENMYKKISLNDNPYGDGNASKMIVKKMMELCSEI